MPQIGNYFNYSKWRVIIRVIIQNNQTPEAEVKKNNQLPLFVCYFLFMH